MILFYGVSMNIFTHKKISCWCDRKPLEPEVFYCLNAFKVADRVLAFQYSKKGRSF